MPESSLRYWHLAAATGLLLAALTGAHAQSSSSGGAARGAAAPGAASPAPSSPAPSSPATKGPPSGRLPSLTNMPRITNPATGAASQSPPAAVIAPPAAQVPPITPLSPQEPTNVQSGGGTPKQGSLALSPGSSSENAPSTPGGGGKTMSDCMSFWEPATHMTKAEWRAACRRTLGRIQ